MKDLTGHVFWRLTVLRYSHSDDRGRLWLCQCSCGKTTILPTRRLCAHKDPTRSCGCFRSEVTSARRRTHGEGYGSNKTPEYNAWLNIRRRCLDESRRDYDRYGGRGIKICDRWLESYENFLADMGRRPGPEYSIERKENDGDYEPDNCRWATAKEQARNRRSSKLLSYRGKTYTQVELSELTGLKRECIAMRLKRGWTVERVVETLGDERSR